MMDQLPSGGTERVVSAGDGVSDARAILRRYRVTLLLRYARMQVRDIYIHTVALRYYYDTLTGMRDTVCNSFSILPPRRYVSAVLLSSLSL